MEVAEDFPTSRKQSTPRPIKHYWRDAYLEAAKQGAVVIDLRSRLVALPWDGRMPQRIPA